MGDFVANEFAAVPAADRDVAVNAIRDSLFGADPGDLSELARLQPALAESFIVLRPGVPATDTVPALAAVTVAHQQLFRNIVGRAADRVAAAPGQAAQPARAAAPASCNINVNLGASDLAAGDGLALLDQIQSAQAAAAADVIPVADAVLEQRGLAGLSEDARAPARRVSDWQRIATAARRQLGELPGGERIPLDLVPRDYRDQVVQPASGGEQRWPSFGVFFAVMVTYGISLVMLKREEGMPFATAGQILSWLWHLACVAASARSSGAPAGVLV